jgi:hypothetical protein
MQGGAVKRDGEADGEGESESKSAKAHNSVDGDGRVLFVDGRCLALRLVSVRRKPERPHSKS